MADQFQIVPYKVRSAGTDVPPEEVQAGLNSLALQTTVALNTLAAGEPPTGPAGGDLSGTYPNPNVAAVHATSGTLDGVVIGSTTRAAGHFTTADATTPITPASGGTGRNALTANAVLIGEGSSQVNFAAPAAAGTLLASNGVSADPSFQTATALNVALTTGTLGQFASTTSAQLAGVISDETGTGALVFGTAPTLSNPVVGTQAAHDNTTKAASTAFVETEFASPPTTGIGNVTPQSGAFTTLSSTGTFTPSQTAGIVGTTTNNNANAGSVGEYITATLASGSAIGLTNSSAANVITISLTAGDWDVSGIVNYTINSATVVTQVLGGVSNVSLNFLAGLIAVTPVTPTGAAGYTSLSAVAPEVRFSLAATTTVYLVANASFNTNTCSAWGTIRARRVR